MGSFVVAPPPWFDFAPAALRADLAADRVSVGRLYSAAELISRAADLSSDSAGLVHDNERRWRSFRARVRAVVDSADTASVDDRRGEKPG